MGDLIKDEETLKFRGEEYVFVLNEENN